jgi:hypothetical protein
MVKNFINIQKIDATVKIWNLSEKNYTADSEEYAVSYTVS